mgnify:CR=1 FL=1
MKADSCCPARGDSNVAIVCNSVASLMLILDDQPLLAGVDTLGASDRRM